MNDVVFESHNGMLGCERFAGSPRLRAICEGAPDLSLEKVNEYRKRWGLEPLKEDEVPPRQIPAKPTHKSEATPRRRHSGNDSKPCTTCGGGKRQTQQTRQPTGHGPGSKLLEDFARAGAPHCEECLELAAKMDEWGKQGCEEHLDEIVEDILPRAQKWMEENRPWVHKFLKVSHTEDMALRAAVRKKVRSAIRKAEASPARTDPPPSNGKTRRSKKRKRRERNVDRKRRPWKPRGDWASAFKPGGDTPEYISTEQLASDTLSLVPRVPPDITHIAAVSRSGLAPGTLLSMALHLPMIVVRHHQGDWVAAGNGWRLNEGTPKGKKKILVVDDTTMTGNSLKRTKHVIEKMEGEKLYAAVYVNPAAKAFPDIWAVDLPWPHLLEWNLFNSVLLDSFALDFDGILCRDCPREDDDDGPRYERFLDDAIPLHLVRKRPAKLIVTARLERYRPHTLAWMNRWGVKTKELVMGPWASLADRQGSDVADWKASALQKFLEARSGIKPRFYIESNARQAARIAELTGRLVVCPPAGRCFGKAKK